MPAWKSQFGSNVMKKRCLTVERARSHKTVLSIVTIIVIENQVVS